MPIVVGSYTESPGQRSLSSLATEVARYVKMPNIPEALQVAKDGINEGIRRLNMVNWEWSLTYQDLTLVADTADYDLAARFRASRMMELLDANGKTLTAPLSFLTPREFSLCYPNRTQSGSPGAYTAFAVHESGQISFSCPLSAGFVSQYPTARLWYYQRVAYLTSDSDVVDAPSEVESFLVYIGKAEVASVFDEAKERSARANAEDVWRKLRAAHQDHLVSDWSE